MDDRMALARLTFGSRYLVGLLAILLALHTMLPLAASAARLAERLELKALGLLDTVDCHPGRPGHQPGHWPTQEATCECCLTGCGSAGPTVLSPHREADAPLISSPLGVRLPRTVAGHLRSYVDERTRSPRSPPKRVI